MAADAPILIYCADGNPRCADIAAAVGFRLGARLPGNVRRTPLYFADQDWKTPDLPAYLKELEKYRPTMATALDWERADQLPEVLAWAEAIAPFVENVVIVPKVPGQTHQIPAAVGGKPVILGYSIPTRYGGTLCGLWEFAGREVHLLGGSPHEQIRIWGRLRARSRVVSADGSMMAKMARVFCKFWSRERYESSHWIPVKRAAPAAEENPNVECFRLSCDNIRAAWALASEPMGGLFDADHLLRDV